MTLQTVCHPLWDGASCVPPTIAGEATSFPCMTMYNNKLYSAKCEYYATRVAPSIVVGKKLYNL